MARILVCENWQYTGRLIGDEAEKDDHSVVVLAKDNDKNYVIDNLELAVQEIQPDYMIVDSLNDKSFEAIEIAKRVKPDVVAIVHTTHSDIYHKAKALGIPCFKKHSCQDLDNMFMYIYEHSRGIV
jgi:hypothetical protein